MTKRADRPRTPRRRRPDRPRKTHGAERLEPRQLLAAEGLAFALETAACRPFVGAPSRSLVVLDAGLAAQPGIAASFADAVATIAIGANQDPLSLVSTELERLGGVSSIHLVTHGSPGSFTLGNTRFDGATIDDTAAGLLAWNRLAGPGSDLYLWGCDIAGGDGASLIDSIHDLSGFDVGASIDVTGPAALGGDFDLEYAAGDVAAPALVAGVDVLWDMTLAPAADHTFTTASKTAMQAAFNSLNDTVAPAISTALTGQTSAGTLDSLAQRTISDLFTDATSVSPADVQSLLELKSAAATYLAGASPTLSGLAAAINTAIAAKATSAGVASGARTITVTPSVSGNLVSLQVAITATGTKQTPVDLGTDLLPTTWNKVVQALNNDYGAFFRTTPQLETGTRLTTGFTIELDLTNSAAPAASLAISSTNLAGGIYSFGPGLRFGILDATLGGQPSLPYSTTVSFGTLGASRAIADWVAPDATASSLGTPSTTLDLPITASINGVAVTSATTKLRIVSTDPTGVIPPTITGIDLGRLVWFGNLTSDELINAIKRVGGAYEVLGTNEALTASIPFVQRRSLLDIFAFGDLFDEGIGSVIDVSVPTVMPTEAGSGITFSVTAGGTQLTLTGDKRSDVSVGQAIGLVPSTPTALDAVIRTVTAVTLSGGNTLVTINSSIDGTTTAGSLVPTTPVRPDNLQTLADFQNYPGFAALGISPVYDPANGTVSLQVATSRSTPVAGQLANDSVVRFTYANNTYEVTVAKSAAANNATFAALVADFNTALATARQIVNNAPAATTVDLSSSYSFSGTLGRLTLTHTGTGTVILGSLPVPNLLATPAVAFNADPLGNIAFSGGAAAGTTDVKLAFGVKFDIGPGGPIVIGLGGQPVGNGRLPADATVTFTSGSDTWDVTVKATDTSTNSSFADLVADFNAARATAQKLVDGTPETNPDRTPKLTDISASFEFFSETAGEVSVRTTGASPTTLLSGQAVPTLTRGRLTADAVFTVTPVGSTGTTVTVSQSSTSTNDSIDDLVTDVNTALSSASVTLVTARKNSAGTGIEFFTPTVNSSMPIGIKITATRTQGNADLGISDGLPSTVTDPITLLGRPSGVTSVVVPHTDTTKKFAETKLDWQLNGLAGTVGYGINTVAFGTTVGDVDATYSAVLAAGGGSAEAVTDGTGSLLTSSFAGAASLDLKTLSRVGATTNDISPSAVITIAVPDLTAELIDSFVDVGAVLSVPGLEDSGRGTGRLSADSKVRFSFDADLYEITVTQATASNNTTFADLVANFNQALTAARKVVNGTPDTTQSYNLFVSGPIRVTGSGGRVSVMRSVNNVLTPLLENLLVPNLTAGGGETGRLATTSSLSVIRGADTYTVTVPASATTGNTTFADLVADFNAAFASARRLLPGQSVPNLAANGLTNGRLATDASLQISRGVDTYTVTVLASATTTNTTFADLVADFNAALQTAQKQTDTVPVTVDARGLLVFSLGQTSGQLDVASIEDASGIVRFAAAGTAGRVQPQSLQEIANPGYAVVTIPQPATMGDIGYQSELSVKSIANALTEATRVFDVLERDLKEYTSQEIPLIGQPLGDLIDLNAGLTSRIQAFGKLSASSPEELERGLATSLGVPSADLQIAYDAVRKAYRIDFAYKASKLTTVAFDVDMGVYYELLGKALPKGIDSLTDGDAKTPLSVVINSTSVISVGYDLVNKKTFLYGHDGSSNHGVSNGTSFTITFSVNGQNLQFPAKFGMDVRNGTAQLTNGSLVVELDGPTIEKPFTASGGVLTVGSTTGLAIGMPVTGDGIPAGTTISQITSGTQLTLSNAPSGSNGTAIFQAPASSRYEIFPTPNTSERAALTIDSYSATFSGQVRAIMPIFDAFAPANLTAQSSQEMLSSIDNPTLLSAHPASLYLSVPDLGGYLDAVSRLEEARNAITALTSAQKTVDADGIQLGNEIDMTALYGTPQYYAWRASWRGRLQTAAEDLGGVLFAFAPELENSKNLLGAQESLIDYIRDPAMILDKLNAAIGGVESALKGLDKIPLPFMEGKLGGAVSSIFSFRTGWLLDMRNKMRGAGESLFDVMRQSVFEYLGPKHANILLKYDPVSMDRSLDSMVSATRPEDIGVVFMDKKGEVLSTDVRGADAFEIVFRLGQKVFDTGIDLGFQLDALQSIGIGAAFNGGLRLQVGWEMLLGFGFSIKDGFYIKVDSTGDAGSRGNLSGSTGQFEAQLRFDATLTGASKNYTQRWDAGASYWKIVDTKGTTVTTDDSDVIDALTGQPYRAIAVNNRATDVTALVATDPTVYDPCGCGDPPAATTAGQQIWWVVGTDSGNGSFVPAELNDQGMYIPQTSPYPHTLIEVTAMKPAQLAGSLFFLRLAATDKIRRGLSGYTDVDSQYFYDASDGPQVTAEQRDNETTGVNRNNELPTRFSAAVGLNMADPSAKANRFTVRTWPQAPAGAGTQRVVDPFGKLAVGDSGAIAKPGTAWSLAPLFWQESEIPGVYAKEYYEFKLKAAPPAKYTALDLPVRLATDGNIALRGMGVIDGVQVKVGDRVLVKGQALAEENGIYTVAPGGWTRSYDANENIDFNGGTGKPMFVLVEEGRSNKNTGWNLRDDTGNVTLGTTPLYFERTMVSVRENLIAGTYTFRSVPYQPYITLPILAELIDQQSGGSLNIQVEYDQKNYVITLDPSAGGPGRALRTAQLNLALAQARLARLNAKGEVEAIPDNTNTFNLAQAGYTFVTPTDADKKWYRIEFARLKEVDGVVSRQADRVGTFVDYGTPATRSTIGTAKGWDPIADINADASPGRITWREFRSAGVKNIFQVDFHADAVANLTMELSIGDTASSVNLTIPRIYADFNLDWSTRAARARVEQTKQDLKDSAQSKTQGTTQQPADDDYSDSLTQMFGDEEEAVKSANMGGDKGIDPSSPLLKEMDLKPEIGFNNIRLDVGSFLTKFMKPIVDEAEPYLSRVRPVLQFFNSRIPVLSDVAGRTIRVVDLLEAYGGPKGKTVRAVIDVVTAVDNLVARIAALPPNVNIQIPMGRFWFPKEFDDPSAINGRAPAPGSKYKYGSLVYDNLVLGKRASGYYGGSNSTADADAKAAIDALKATNPNSDEQKRKQGFISNNAADRGGFRIPLLEDPLNLFQLMMGKTATLVTFQLPKLQYEFEQSIPLLKIVCFEVGLRASFEMDANLAFGFDTYGINQYMASGDIADIAQGFYVSDRANADGTGADIAEFRAVASFGLYGGIDLVLAKGGIEGGLRFIGEVNLNDPNNDGKLRLTEAIGLLEDTHNPLDLFDLSFRGEVYARYYYKVGLGKLAIKGGKTFARKELFNLVHEGSDGTPIYASRIDGTEGNAVPGTLLLHVGESAAKRVSNQDPLNAKDGAERYKIWNSGDTVSVQYLNYSNSITKTWTGVKVVLFEGGLGDDTLDASGLNGIPLIFKGGDGNDSVTLGSGSNDNTNSTVTRLDGEDGNDTIIVNGGGIVELVGGVGNDIITGGTGLVRIEAGEGNDSITTRAGSMSTLVMADDYGTDMAALASTAVQNLLDFTTLASAIEFLLDAALGNSVDGTATAGSKNKLTFNVGGVTEIRGSSQDDTFTVRNPRTRDASRLRLGARLASSVSSNGDVPEFEVPFLAADGATTGRLAADSSVFIETDRYTYIVTVPQSTAANNFSPSQLFAQFQAARSTAKRVDRSDPSAAATTVDATTLFDFLLPTVAEVSGLLLRGGLGDDLYDLTLDNVGAMGTDGILIDDTQGVIPARTGDVETCGTCKEIKSIAVVLGGKGYQLPPEVVIVDPTGSGAKATAVLDDEGRVTSIQVIEGGSGYTNPTAFLVAPRSLGDQLVVSSTRPAAELHTPQTTSQISTFYQYTIDTKRVRFVGWGDASRPVGLDQSEVDSVTVNMPEGVLTVGDRINLFQTFTVNTSRMVQNARVVADTIDIETDHGFQVKHPLHAVNSGDVRIRVTANGTNTGEGSDLNATANRATATTVVSAGGVASLTSVSAGSKYFFTPSITVGANGVTPGTGARFAATLAGNGGGLSGFTQLSPGTGYYTSPAPIVVIPPPASIQVDAMITSSMTSAFGYGDGRGRVLLYADTGMVSTSGEVYFPVDTRPGTPQGARTIDWIDGDFRYRSTVGLDDIVSPTTYPGVSVGTGAAFTATLDADGRVTGFTKVSGGSGYSQDLPPLVEIEGLATAVPVVGSDGSLTGLRLTYPGDGYGQAPRVTIKPNGFGRVVNSPNGIGSGMTADGVTPMNRAHIRAIGGTFVAVAGAGVGDPLKPIKTDVEKFVAQVTASGGVHVLEKDGVRIGKDQSVSGITTANGDVSITTFGGTLELGAPRQAVDEQGRLLWQDPAKTIPIYDRDPVTGRIIYEGGDIRVGSGNVKLTADDVEVNVDLNSSGGTGTITLQPVNMKAEIGLAGTRARVEGVVTNGQLTGFDATKFWGGRGYTTAPLVIVDPAGQRAFASAVVDAGKVTAIDVLFGGTNYDPASPPLVTFSGVTPANQARARAIVGLDGVISGFELLGGTVELGRLKADSAIRFTQGSDTYEVTVTQATAANNNTFADLVADFQAALAVARKVVNGTPNPTQTFNIASQFQFLAGTFGQIGLRHIAVTPAVDILTNYVVPNLDSIGGSGYSSVPNVSIASPGQALVQAVLDTANPDPVTGRFSVKEFVITNAGRNYQSAPSIEVAAPYDFTLDADEVAKFAGKFAQVVIGRIEGQHLFHSPEGTFQGNVVLRAPRAGGTLDVASFTTTGPVSIVGSGNTFHFDSANASISGTSISIDDNVIVHAGVSGTATATTGSIVVFGTGKGMIDGDPTGDDVGDNEDLSLSAHTFVTVTGAIGSRWALDDLTVTSATRGAIDLQQSVTLTGDLDVTGGAVTIGGVVDVDGDLVIDASSMVFFAGNVHVGGNLVITGATGVTFAGTLTVGGSLSISQVSGSVRFSDLVSVTNPLNVSASTLIEVLGGLVAGGTTTFTSNEVEFKGGTATITGTATKTLTVQPFTSSRAIRVGTPTGSASGTLDVSDFDLAAIAAGWGRVVIGDATSGSGGVTVGSIGTQQGSKNSSLANSTTIVGGSVTVVQKVDAANGAGELLLQARTGDVTVNAAINETATDRSATVSMQAAGAISITAPVSSAQTINLTSGGTTSQTTAGPLTTTNLRVDSQGAVSLLSPTNAWSVLAVATSNDDIAIREDSGYAIGSIGGLNGIQVGTATARLISSGQVTQSQTIGAGRLDLQGAGGQWTLTAANAIGTLAADTGSLAVSDAAQMNVASLVASQQTGTAITLSAPTGLSLTAPITTAGGNVVLNNAVTLTTDVVINVVAGGRTGLVDTVSTIEGTTPGQESLTITGNLSAGGSIGSTTPLESLSVSGDSTFTAGISLRTTGNQTYSGSATSSGTVTIGAADGSTVGFLGDATLGGLVTATATNATNYSVVLTGTSVSIMNAMTFANTGSVTLGNQTTDNLLFVNGLTSTAPSISKLAGTVRTTNADAAFGRKPGGVVELTADTAVSTGVGRATFSGTVDGPYRLVVNAAGDTTFSSAVGGGTALTHLETDAPGRTLVNGGSVRTASPTSQVYNDDVVLGANTTLTASDSGAVTFVKTLNGDFTLAVNTAGITTFGGAVGNGTPLKSLTTDAVGMTKINGGSVATSTAAGQVFNDDVELGANATFDATNNGAVTFVKTLNGDFTLTVNTAGITTFGGAIGNGTPLKSLTTDAAGATKIDAGSVRTSEAAGQVYNDDVELLSNTTLAAAGIGAVTFAKTLNGDVTLAVNTAGITTFGGAVGNGTPLKSLTTDADGTTKIDAGSVKTSAAAGQVYNDDVDLLSNTAITAAANGDVTFAKTLNGGSALAVNTAGITTFGGAVGTVRPLASLATNALGTTRISGGTITTFDAAGQVYGDDVVLLTDTTLNAGAGAVTFGGAVNGPGSLTVNTSGTTTFSAAVGGDTPLAAITTNAGGTSRVNGGLVRTTGSQSWLDDVDMPIDTLLRSLNGAIVGGPANTFSAPGRAVTFTASTGVGNANPIRVAAGSVVATVSSQGGGIALTGVGDLVIGAAGLSAPGPVALDASGTIRVPTGGTIAGGTVAATKAIHWSVTTTVNAGVGSLRQVLANANAVGNANASGRDAVIVFSGLQNPARFVLQAQLPTIASDVAIDGSGSGVVIDGNRVVQHGLTFGPQAAGSLLQGVTISNFTGYGIQLLAAPGVTVDGVTVRSLNTETSMGLYATGDLVGTTVVRSTFSGGLRGALLDSARNLAFGQIGSGNVLSNNQAAPTNRAFAGTGIRAQGLSTGTVVAGNTFTANNYGFAFIGANNLRLDRNTFTRNNVAGIYIEGDSRGSVQVGSVFGTAQRDRNKVDLLRTRTAQFGGPAVATVVQSQMVVSQKKKQ